MSRIFQRSSGAGRFIKSHVIKIRYVNLVCNFKLVPLTNNCSTSLGKSLQENKDFINSEQPILHWLPSYFPLPIERCKMLYEKRQYQLLDWGGEKVLS